MIGFPNAKINIGLRVTGRRDDGFHNIETIMVPLKLTDALEITPSADGLPGFSVSGLKIEGEAGDNLCMRAFRLMQKKYSLPEVKIHLHKVIPTGAGLGGGSSDAAFTLKLLNRLFSLKLCNSTLSEIAAEIGSDCPFFIENTPCFASGRGEILRHIDFNFSRISILLIKPDISVATAWAYQHVTPGGSPLMENMVIPDNISEWNHLFTNDFEAPVFEAWPEIARIKQTLLNMGALYASMSGSGSAVYGLFYEVPDYKDAFDGSFVWKCPIGI